MTQKLLNGSNEEDMCLTLTEKAEQIWSHVPRKVAKIAGIKAIKRALVNGKGVGGLSRYQYLLEATKRWCVRDKPKVERGDHEKVPHPRTWFSQGRYDDSETWRKPASPRSRWGMTRVEPEQQPDPQQVVFDEWLGDDALKLTKAERTALFLDRYADKSNHFVVECIDANGLPPANWRERTERPK